jgi:hypothetical protein
MRRLRERSLLRQRIQSRATTGVMLELALHCLLYLTLNISKRVQYRRQRYISQYPKPFSRAQVPMRSMFRIQTLCYRRQLPPHRLLQSRISLISQITLLWHKPRRLPMRTTWGHSAFSPLFYQGAPGHISDRKSFKLPISLLLLIRSTMANTI